MKFNNEQETAIQCGEGVFAITASSGSGKSTLMVERCRRLVKEKKINPKKILITTFTNASSQDLKKKLINVECDEVETGTFHSICQRVLCSNGINAFNTIPEYKITNEFRKIIDKPKTQDILSWISYQKNYGIKPSDNFVYKECGYEEYELRKLFNTYEELKTKSKCLDYEDWLLIAIDLLKNNNAENDKFRYDYIMIDEHQDSNKLQLELIKLLCPKNNIFMVFDEKQRLYGFRGSDKDYCLHIENYFPTVTRLHVSTNYRSCKNIVENSNKFAKIYYGKYKSYKDSIPYVKEDGIIHRLKFIDKDIKIKWLFNAFQLQQRFEIVIWSL
jgi:DNA helicase-2/ATP-dependent DNA helicase PcrA